MITDKNYTLYTMYQQLNWALANKILRPTEAEKFDDIAVHYVLEIALYKDDHKC